MGVPILKRVSHVLGGRCERLCACLTGTGLTVVREHQPHRTRTDVAVVFLLGETQMATTTVVQAAPVVS